MRSTRRFFLASSALSGMGVVVASASQLTNLAAWASQAAEGAAMRLGLVTYLWGKDWDLPTLLANCRKAEIFGVELRTEHAHGVEPEIGPERRREVRQMFVDSGITLVGLGSNERFDHPDAAALRRAIERTKAFVKLSYDCGGSGVKVKPDRFHPKVPREKTIEQIGRSLNEVAAFAADYGQQIRLEVHGECAPLPIIKQIMDIADHPNVGVCWNSNAEDLQGEGLEHNFRLVARRLGATVHVRELNLGDYPYQRLIELLVEVGYRGWVLLECRTDPPDKVAALVEQRQIWEKMLTAALNKVKAT
ncbi:MAG: sugar phosphate isomerase/epimerase [Thermoguttaceae bacterium]|nr:sugar phosphate isomerase/epimerase [Thermoguttaceae bacterium]MDW8078923.1 sugar phosphate isomerase/epimerase family protein [Thermoguttaceae bacterium]